MNLEDNPAQALGKIYDTMIKAGNKELGKMADKEGCDPAFWKLEINVKLHILSVDFGKMNTLELSKPYDWGVEV